MKKKRTKLQKLVKFLYNKGKRIRDGEELLQYAYKNFVSRRKYLIRQTLRTRLYQLQKKGIVKIEVPLYFWHKSTRCVLIAENTANVKK